LSTTYKSLSSILLSRLTPYAEEVIGYHGEFLQQVDRPYIQHSSNTREKKWEYSEAVQQLFIDLKEAYDSVRRKVL
jgi:hypothetical protein